MTGKVSIDESLEHATHAAKQGNYEEAATFILQILAEDPNNLKALDLGGFVWFFQKRYGEAEEFCRRALSIRPNHPYALKGLGLCLARQGHLEEGCQSLEKAIAEKPEWFDPYWDLAVVLKEAGQYEKAKRVLDRGKRNVPAKTSHFEKFEALLDRLDRA